MEKTTFTCDKLTKNKARFVSPREDGKATGSVQGSVYLDKAGYSVGSEVTVSVEPNKS